MPLMIATPHGPRPLANAERGHIAAHIRNILARCTLENRDPSAAEAEELDDCGTKMDLMRAYDQQTAKLIRGIPIGGGGAKPSVIDLAVSGWIRNAHGEPIPTEEYEAARELGMNPLGGGFGVDLPITRGRGKNVSFSAAGQGTAPGSAGGLLVPTGFIPQLEQTLKLYSTMLQVSEVMTTEDSRQMAWPTIDDTTNEGTQLGEGVQVADAALVFGANLFRAYKFTSGVIKVSTELLRDSAISLAKELGTVLGTRLGRILNRKATVGTGAATLNGITVDASVGVTAASSTTLTWDELVRLQHSVDPAYRVGDGVGWLMHSDIAGFVRRLKDGMGHPLWEEDSVKGMPPLFLGDPVYFNQHMDNTMATGKNTVLYGKLDQYKMRIVNRVRFRRLDERYADTDQVGFISFLECDGKLLKPSTDATLCPVRMLQHP